ncbi:hypothetical protein [Paenibacillus contaminans]|uniref:Uncharacterized protein n=1 Tax=Paenibacillus contaminans TaxID=450362 RepID=A0A329MIG7_9BACL|nr:hypothetical protein [Paenibacillus contaminans]RAV19510.1 hypothetical protein DQG23_21220 [Paenibacillus contaminans]
MQKTFTVDVFNATTGQFDIGTVTLTPYHHQIGYYRDHRSQNYIVSLVDSKKLRQQIVVLPAAFFRILPELADDPIAGLAIITRKQLLSLGFVLTRGEVTFDAVS